MKYIFIPIAILWLHSCVRAQTVSTAETYFTNVELIDQYGEPRQLFTDLMKDKVVIVNAFYSVDMGPDVVMNSTLQKIQEYLGEKMGASVHILSLTVDYQHDTPSILRSYSERWNAGKGWYFLTGEKENNMLALRKFGLYVEDKERHSNIFMIGNLKTGLWKKVFGLSKADEIIKIIETVINDKGE